MESKLRKKIEGDVRFDEVAKTVYSVDASIYEIEPLGIVIPKTRDDLIHTVQIAAEERVPLIPRGAATGTTGGCIGKGLIVDMAQYLNQIHEINYDKGYAICEPGVVLDDLNRALAEKGYRLGPSTSTGNRATIGGMFANNAAGAHSLLYGQTGDHVLEVEMVLADGEVVTFKEMTITEWKKRCLTSPLYQKLWDIREEYKQEIDQRFPKIKRMVSGYHLPSLIDDESFNPCRLLAGSEGTLGIVSKIKFKIVPIPKQTTLYALHFSDLLKSMNAIEPLLSLDPIAVEMIDREIIESGKTSPTMHSRLGWLEGNPASVLAVEFMEPVDGLHNLGADSVTVLDSQNCEDIWAVRKAGLELLLSKRSYKRAIAFIEDITIPPKNLPAFMQEFTQYLEKQNRTAGIYGHVGEACIHIRPYINLMEESDLKLMEKMALDVSDMVLQYEGVMSGEHGDGLVRSWLNKKMFTPHLYQALCKVKSAFDPHNIMNPGKVVNGQPLLENLRSSPHDHIAPFETFLNFDSEDGFELAVDMCNGNGLCRKKETVMCPSFQVTGSEYDTTRARAQVLRAIILGKLQPESLSHPGVHDVLDLCLECKGCKKECPSQVDMAKMKSEALYHYQLKNGVPFRSRFFGNIGKLNQWGSLFPRFTNFINNSAPMQYLFDKLGITTKRPLPQLAPQKFSQWFAKYKQPSDSKHTVVLFNDTYCEFHEPEIGKAAVKVLNALGYEVVVSKWSCCGRPFMSKGLLPDAQSKAQHLIEILKPYVEKNLPILFLEPSCLSMLTDDILGLVKTPEAHLISNACMSIDTFLAQRIDQLPFKSLNCDIKFHGHCHQKSLWGVNESLKALSAIPGTYIHDISAGCCGCAGSFGYEAEHYELSMKIGELKLFPAVRQSSEKTKLVANGFSCRSQISHGTGRKAYHVIEVIESALNKN